MMFLILALACTQEPAATVDPSPPATVEAVPPADPAPDADVQKAATIGLAIEKDPTRVDAILQENGTNREAFEALLFDIANDPARSAAYSLALGEPAS